MDAVAIPGGRDVRAVLDGGRDGDAVVACPPHPRHGGSRTDDRLLAVSDALAERDVACLRLDFGPWADGEGERRDAENALAWARTEFDAVGLFGYSFGAGIALRAAVAGHRPAAVSALAPPADGADALDDVACPVQVVYGGRDETVEWRPVVERARKRGFAVESLSADHHFVGRSERVAALVADFLVAAVGRSGE